MLDKLESNNIDPLDAGCMVEIVFVANHKSLKRNLIGLHGKVIEKLHNSFKYNIRVKLLTTSYNNLPMFSSGEIHYFAPNELQRCETKCKDCKERFLCLTS